MENRIGKELGESSLLDERTGLYTRQGFLSLAQQMVKLAARKKRDVLLVHADLKNLEAIRERFGEDAGEEARLGAAEVLHRTFRKSDVISCFDGDEFFMITIETRKGGAEALTGRLLENIRRRNAEAGAPELTMRVGTASFDPQGACSIEAILAKTEEMIRKDDDALLN